MSLLDCETPSGDRFVLISMEIQATYDGLEGPRDNEIVRNWMIEGALARAEHIYPDLESFLVEPARGTSQHGNYVLFTLIYFTDAVFGEVPFSEIPLQDDRFRRLYPRDPNEL